ncbi:hypothetical protein QVD99_007021 [Batrachochytrium dendrobatidis]|nr:hypothetical protein O5D80_007708 [Batrachochytrium dendrobatidis]KAK5666258.1 hypothetical protein QVD99_007021 [Batrachochytrium dendrobatidis]
MASSVSVYSITDIYSGNKGHQNLVNQNTLRSQCTSAQINNAEYPCKDLIKSTSDGCATLVNMDTSEINIGSGNTCPNSLHDGRVSTPKQDTPEASHTDFSMYTSRFPEFEGLLRMMDKRVKEAFKDGGSIDISVTALSARHRLRHVPSIRKPPVLSSDMNVLNKIKSEINAETVLLQEDRAINERLKRALQIIEQENRKLKDRVDTQKWRLKAKSVHC